jgi:membrane protein YqaA with SNARE-associated domain
MKNWFKNLYKWSLQLANTKWGIWVLFLFAFADASIIPLPVTTFFLVLIVLNTKRIFKYSLIVVLGTLTGALAGYATGHFAWINPQGEYTGLVQFLFNHIPGFSEDTYNKINLMYSKWDFWILCGAATTPVPYGFFSISSGVFNINIFAFSLATLISQGIKYFVLALVTIKLSPKAKKLMEFNWKPVAIIGIVCITILIVVTRAL